MDDNVGNERRGITWPHGVIVVGDVIEAGAKREWAAVREHGGRAVPDAG
jgi:hypothetical protein